MAAARTRGAVGSLCRYDLGPAVALEVPLARVDAETRERFLRVLDEQRRLVAEEEQRRKVAEDQGLAKKGARRHHRPASLERLAIRRAPCCATSSRWKVVRIDGHVEPEVGDGRA